MAPSRKSNDNLENFRLPPDTDSLIAWLDKTFPHRCPHPDQTMKDIWLYAGKRELIDFLLAKLKLDLEEEDDVY